MRTPTRAVLLALAVTTASLLTACDPATPPTATTADNPSVGITTHSVVTSGSGQTTPATSPAQQVSDWWTGGGKDRTSAISADLSKMSNDSSGDPATVGDDCSTLSKDLSSALTYKPIPDAQAQQHWSAALDKYQQAATDCQAGVTATDASLITKAGTEITEGTTQLTLATARIQQIAASG